MTGGISRSAPVFCIPRSDRTDGREEVRPRRGAMFRANWRPSCHRPCRGVGRWVKSFSKVLTTKTGKNRLQPDFPMNDLSSVAVEVEFAGSSMPAVAGRSDRRLARSCRVTFH